MTDLLPCVEIEPRDAHRSTVIWLHGLGASGHDFEPIVPHLRMPWARFVFPHAAERPVTINAGFVMPAWYDIISLTHGPERESEPDIRQSQREIEALIRREAERVPTERIVLAGFSQGGAMALHVGHRYPERLQGILVLSAYLVLESTLGEGHPANAETPLLFAHGTHDDVVPCRAGRRAFDTFARPGRRVDWREYPMAHEVCPAEIRDITAWLHDTTP